MIFLQNIPHQKVYKQRVYLPKDDKAPTMYNVIFSNNNDIKTTINLMKHPLLVTNHKYLNYYTEPIYKTRVGLKNVNINHRKERENIYDVIDKEFKMINTPLKFELLRNKNVYYDLFTQNSIFFKNSKSGSIQKRIELYIDFIMGFVNNAKFKSYKNKIIMIDVESWMSTNNTIHNPVMYLFLAYRKYFDLFAKIGNIDIVFYTKDMLLRVNPSLCDDKTFFIFKRELNKLTKKINLENDDEIDKEIQKEDIKEKISSEIKDDVYHFTGEDDEIDELVDDKVDDVFDEYETSHENEDEELPDSKEVEDELQNNKELIQAMAEVRKNKVTGKSTASLARDEELKKKQRALKLDDITIDDYSKIYESGLIDVEEVDISDKITTTNENMKKVKFTNFEKTYNEKLMKKDLVNIITDLNDKSIPVYVKDIKVEDTSDELNYKETYTVVLEDANRVRHTLKFDMPKFIEDKFLYLGGNKKIIVKQLFMKPIVKLNSDQVRICSNYSRLFLYRYGTKLSAKMEKFKKAISNNISGVSVGHGDSSLINNKYKSILEYDELAKSLLQIKTPKFEILFNQDDVHKRLGDTQLKPDEFCVGFYSDKKPIIMSYESERIGDLDLIDFIISNGPDKLKSVYEETTTTSKRFMFTRVKIMNKFVPIILLLGYCEGLSAVLKKANIEHYFTDKRPAKSDSQKSIQFADGYLVYNAYPFENSLLLNALDTIPTKAFEYADFDEKEIYVELFQTLYGARNIANAFDSFYEFMIDPITKEVLTELDQPTDFVGVILYGNSLLVDNSFIPENNMNLYRIRSNEIVNGILHKQIADAYAKYRATANNKNPVKISIPQDAVIKEILTSNIVEEFSVLNPIYEVEKTRAITPKGPNGVNLADSFTQDKRSYDKSMMGVMGMSTSPDANVGIVRQLTMEPGVVSSRGFMELKDDDVNQIKDVNMFTTAELLTPMGVSHDDSVRTAMSSKQSKHIIPVTKSSPVLLSNGAEQAIQYNLSKDFVVIADDDGEVVEVDEDTGLVVVKYKNGKSQAVDTKPRVVKNSASGFYISNNLKTDLKVGDKVKKNDVIAYENKFFTNDKINGNRFNIGSLQKVAIMSSYATYEDSTFITKKMSEEMASDIVMMKDVVIGKHANVGQMVEIGDTVDVGDVLISFETSFDDGSMNKFLASVGDELREEITSLGKVPIKTKYSGVIEDIKIYSAVELDELSPSLKKIVSKYYSKINKKKKILEKYDDSKSVVKAGILFNEPTGKTKLSADGKIKGHEAADSVLFEFYIKYADPVGVGDKVTKKLVTLNSFNCWNILRA